MLSGCIGAIAELVVDQALVDAQLPPGFTMVPGRRVILHAATCTAGGALDQTGGDLVYVTVPVQPHEGSGPEFFLLELSTSNRTVLAASRALGVPGDNLTVEAPHAPGGSWELRGEETLYTLTVLPNPWIQQNFPDTNSRLWGGVEGLFAGHVAVDELLMESFPTGCSLLVSSGKLSVFGSQIPCTGQGFEGNAYTLSYDEPVTA